MTSLCRHLSAQEFVNWVTTADGCVHTADTDATKQFRPVGVGGVYWAIQSRGLLYVLTVYPAESWAPRVRAHELLIVTFLPARRYRAVFATATCLSVRLSVCHSRYCV